ncbi:hypothetical protein E3N88_00039 [Mikania micrantha]|uniref:Uncharacterized protein n=1 Tax=Mikania micrantha TaxID=192012 RepID=A0A5N6PXT8_9ASTR|nr:hypothetical protein E3N88_00039 [Mikania micrantha]
MEMHKFLRGIQASTLQVGASKWPLMVEIWCQAYRLTWGKVAPSLRARQPDEAPSSSSARIACHGCVGSGVPPGPNVRHNKPILLFWARSCPFLDCRTSFEHRLVSFELPSSMCECFVKFQVLCYTMCLTFTNVRETRVCFGNSSNYR